MGQSPASPFARELDNMLELVAHHYPGRILRDESRGAHYKPEFPERNDENFLKTTQGQMGER